MTSIRIGARRGGPAGADPRPPRRRGRRARPGVRIVAAVAAVVVVVAVAIGIAYLVTDHGTPERPEVTATAGGSTITTGPFEWCDPKTPTDCDPPGQPARLDVTASTPLTLDVPDSIADAPWSLDTYYVNPDVQDYTTDSLIPQQQIFDPGTTHSVTIDPVDSDGRALAIVEVHLPTGIVDSETGQVTYISHATWSIWTRERAGGSGGGENGPGGAPATGS